MHLYRTILGELLPALPNVNTFTISWSSGIWASDYQLTQVKDALKDTYSLESLFPLRFIQQISTYSGTELYVW